MKLPASFNLKAKVIIIIASLFIAMVVTFAIITRSLLMDGYRDLEYANCVKGAERLQQLFRLRQDELYRLVLDWAVWDDTYAFIRDGNASYIESNVTADTLPNLGIDNILYVRRSGEVLFAGAYIEEPESLGEVSPEIMEYFEPGSPLLTIELEEEALHGIIRTSEGPYLFAVCPVRKTDNSGDVQGVMAVAKKVDAALEQWLGETGLFQMEFFLNEELESAKLQEMIRLVERNNGFYQQIIDSETVCAYGVLKDIQNEPAILYRIQRSRDIIQQGRQTYLFLISSIIITGFLFLIVTVYLVESLVIARLREIQNRLRAMQPDVGQVENLEKLKGDEIGELSQTIHETVERFKKNENDLLRAKESAERDNLARTKFISQLGHDLRSPLSGILGFARLSNEEPMNAELKENIKEIEHAGEHLLTLISEMMDLARLEQGRFEVHKQCVDLIPLLQDAVSILRHDAQTKDIEIIRSYDANERVRLEADHTAVKRVLINLLNNAIKYNEYGGKITLNVHRSDDGMVRIEVRDTGLGVPPEAHETIFHMYERGEAGQSQIEGSGIGLHVCKQLVEAMSGKIGVMSEPGQGSTFWFELPAYPGAGKGSVE